MVFTPLLTLSVLIAGTFASPVAQPINIPRFTSGQSLNPATELARRAEAVNYNQNYVASGASVSYSPNQSTGTYSISYNTNRDFVVGLGWKPGNSDPVTYSGSFSATSGVGILALYGWTTNPLVEYYVQEYYHGANPAGTKKGSFTSDGGTYDIWEHQQVNQPSIQGTSTFQQYISVRTSQRTSGTITVANHFNAWKNAGMNLGAQNFQVMAVESWGGAGSGKITVSKSASGGSTGGGSTGGGSTGGGSTGGGTTGGGTTGSCAAMYGQCGGQGFTGPTCCSSGTCKASNQYYSQCL